MGAFRVAVKFYFLSRCWSHGWVLFVIFATQLKLTIFSECTLQLKSRLKKKITYRAPC